MIDGCDRADVSTRDDRKARKPHRCIECAREIAPGETYRQDKSLYEGTWDTYKTCSHCLVGQAWLADNCGGWVFGSVYEEMVEHSREYQQIGFGLLRVAVGMRRQWKRFDGAGLMKPQPMPRPIADTMQEAA